MAKHEVRSKSKPQKPHVDHKVRRQSCLLLLAAISLISLLAGSYIWWAKGADARRFANWDPPLEVVDFWQATVSRYFWNLEKARTMEGYKQVRAASHVWKLRAQLSALADRLLRYETARATTHAEKNFLLRDRLETEFLWDGTDVAGLLAAVTVQKTLDPKKDKGGRILNDWQLRFRACQPLDPMALGGETVSYRGQRYRLDASGVAALNQALGRDDTSWRLVLGERSSPGFILGRCDSLPNDIWWMHEEHMRSGTGFPTGWTDPYSHEIVVRDKEARQALFELFGLTWLSRFYDPAGKPLVNQPIPPRIQATYRSLKTLRKLVLDRYGLPSDVPAERIADVFYHPGFSQLWADYTSLAATHELGHRRTDTAVGSFSNQFGRHDDGGLNGLGETLAELSAVAWVAQHGALDGVQSRASAERRLYLLMLTNEGQRFLNDQGLKFQRRSSMGYYHTMANMTSLVILSCVRPDRSIDWEKLQRVCEEVTLRLQVQLMTDLPADCRQQVGAHGLLLRPDRVTQAQAFLANDSHTYLEEVMVRGLATKEPQLDRPAIDATREFERQCYREILAIIGLRLPWNFRLETWQDKQTVPLRVTPRRYLDDLLTERFGKE